MFGASKVVWKEGLFLQPQHFQQQERYLLSALDARVSAHHPHYYGLTEVSVDADALENGMFALRRCRGVLPDGTVVDVPGQDTAPPSRPLAEHLPAERQSLDVYCALPSVAEGRQNVTTTQGQPGASTRYSGSFVATQEESLGRGAKEIELGALNLSILFGDESLDGYSAVRIARLGRSPNGQIIVDERHMPPLLQIRASSSLLEEIRGSIQLLMARIHSLAQGRRHVGGGLATFAGGEETAFRLLQTLNTYTPLLSHYHHAPSVHPYEFYTLLSVFCGALCTFSSEVSIADMPQYVHDEPSQVFEGLFGIIRRVLGTDMSTRCVSIPLEQVNPATYVCTVPDARLFNEARFYLGVTASVSEKELIVGSLQRIKMSSRERLDVLIASALSGLQLMHTQRPPEGLSTKPSYVYFSLSQQGELWEGIRTSGTIALYFPNNYPDLRMELLALRS